MIAATGIVALIDDAPGSRVAEAWEDALFDVEGGDLEARLTALRSDLPGSFAAVAANDDGTAIVVCGHASATIASGADALVHHTAEDGRWTHATAGTEDRITLTLTGDDTSTGQWLTIGVIAGATVAVGQLHAPRRRDRSVVQPDEPMPAEGLDFGNLLLRRPAPAPGPPTLATDEPPTDVQPTAATTSADTAAHRRADTAEFTQLPVHTEQPGVIRLGDGRLLDLDAPIVIGRRPPTDPVDGQVPHVVTIDDTMLSRHHVSLRFVDGQLVVVDEDSTNGTTVAMPGASPARCSPRRPVVVPLGATIDVGGVITATYEAGPRDERVDEEAESC